MKKSGLNRILIVTVIIIGMVSVVVGAAKKLLNDSPPPRTNWKPVGCRKATSKNPVIGAPTAYSRAFHSDTMVADEVSIVAAPMFRQDWVAEPGMFVIEGPTFDAAGNIYFSPNASKEKVFLISLDPKDGRRRWTIPGQTNNGAGGPLVLNDPDTPGKQIVYYGSYERAIAVTPDGKILWDVKTGLPPLKPDEDPIYSHCFGLNYSPKTDAVIGETGAGYIYALDRKTGATLLAEPYLVPGEKSPRAKTTRIPKKLGKRIAKEMSIFSDENSSGGASSLIQTIMGGGKKVANYFAIDANTGKIWVAATAPDNEDGKQDGVSEFGALYALELAKDGDKFVMRELFHTSFEGGSASSPSLNADGTRIYVGDNQGNLVAINALNGSKIWSLDVGAQIVASVTVSADNGEIFLPTLKDIIKVKDYGDHGKIIWTADLDIYEPGRGRKSFNLMGGTSTANGLVVHAGFGRFIRGVPLPFEVGVGLLDKETGKLRFFALGREESAAAPTVGPGGSIYIGNSPIRRTIARAFFGDKLTPITGGISKYSPIRHDLLIRDALCAAAERVSNAAKNSAVCPVGSVDADIIQINNLIYQVYMHSAAAIEAGELSSDKWKKIDEQLALTRKNIKSENLELAAQPLSQACEMIP